MNVNEMKFIKLGQQSKFPIKGVSWSNIQNQYSYEDLVAWSQAGNNIGVVCGHNGLVVLDIDRVNECGMMGLVPFDDTLIVQTGSGGLHFYYKCELEQPRKVIFYHPTKTEPGRDGKEYPLHLGELQASKQYVVAPGSIHPNGNYYEIINDHEIIEKPYHEIVERFTAAGCLISAERPKATISSVGAAQTHSKYAGDKSHAFHVTDIWPVSSFKKVGDQYSGVHPVHGSRSGHNLVVDSGRDRWYCFRCGSGGGPVQALAVDARIIECSEAHAGAVKGEIWKQTAHEARDRGLLNKYLK